MLKSPQTPIKIYTKLLIIDLYPNICVNGLKPNNPTKSHNNDPKMLTKKESIHANFIITLKVCRFLRLSMH